MKNMYSLVEIEGRAPNLVLFLLRFYAGFTIMKAGLDKLPLPLWMTEQVTSMGIPFPAFFAWVASFGEFAFGLLLCVGLATRFSAFFLAVIMGVASFGFQKVLPLFDMHIAQYLFWIFVLFMVLGAGKISVDFWLSNRQIPKYTNYKYAAIPVFLILIGFGLAREWMQEAEDLTDNADTTEIMSVNIPGSFNNWDPSAIEMEKVDETNYQHVRYFPKEGLVEFKFTINKSWDINFGLVGQDDQSFPLEGSLDLDQGNNTQNIKVYIPSEGRYRFTVNTETREFSINKVPSEN